MELLGPRAKKRVAKFQAFANAFVDSWPSWAARQQHQYSTTDPAHYLQITTGLPPPKPPTPRRQMPPELLQLLKLQQPNGQWKPSAAVYHCIGDNIPDPKGDMAEWRWCTALCCAFIRRYPEFWPEMEPAYTAATRWVPDDALLELASTCLPPPLDYRLSTDAVKGGAWKHAVKELTDTVGYTAFLPDATVPRDSYAAVEERFARRIPSPTAGGKTSSNVLKGPVEGHSDSETDDEDGENGIDPTLPQWKREQLQAEKAETNRKEKEAKARRKEHRERRELQKLLKHDAVHASSVDQRFLRDQGRLLLTEWEAVADTGERPFRVGECVDVFARRENRWCPLKTSNTPHPATIIRWNIDGTIDIAYLDGAREREYRVPRKSIRRQGELGYEVGVGGWKLMRTRAEGLKDRWEGDIVDKRTELKQLEEVAEGVIRTVPFTAVTTKSDVVLPLRVPVSLEERKHATQRAKTATKTVKSTAGKDILERTLAEISEITGRRKLQSASGSMLGSSSTMSSPMMPTSPSNATSHDRTLRRLDATIAAAEVDVVNCILTYEPILAKVKKCVIEGASIWSNAYSVEVKQTAFVPLTAALAQHRDAVVQLCDAVLKWQQLIAEKEKLQADAIRRSNSVALPALRRPTFTAATTTTMMTSSGQTPTAAQAILSTPLAGQKSVSFTFAGEGDSTPTQPQPSQSSLLSSPGLDSGVGSGKTGTSEPPPFMWNGNNVLVKICTVLDYLNTIPELKEWYTDTYPYVNNPLAMHTQLSERPETPVKTTRKVLVGGEEVEQEVESLIQQHELQAGKLKAWGSALNSSPAWWPVCDMVGFDGFADDEVVKVKANKVNGCRRASKLLLAELQRDKDRHDKLASLQQTLHRTSKSIKSTAKTK